MKRFIAIILVVLSIMTCSIAATSEDYIPSESSSMSEEQVLAEIAIYARKKQVAHEMAEAARILGFAEDSSIIISAKEEWNKANEKYNYYKAKYDEIQKNKAREKHYAEYAAAAQIWYFLKDELSYNDYVCAGILGNIMAEVGGQTLNIQYWLSGNGYYGMCQWSNYYCKDVIGLNLEGQCEYLKKTIKYEFDTFGFVYGKGFNYESFTKISNEKDAAMAFAQCYERCAKEHYYIRTVNATKAYNYFVG